MRAITLFIILIRTILAIIRFTIPIPIVYEIKGACLHFFLISFGLMILASVTILEVLGKIDSFNDSSKMKIKVCEGFVIITLIVHWVSKYFFNWIDFHIILDLIFLIEEIIITHYLWDIFKDIK